MALGRRAPVSLRVNPDVDAGTHPYISTGLKGNKFGIAHDQALAAYRHAAVAARPAGGGHRLPHRLADHRRSAPYLDALDRVLDLVEAVEAAGIPIHHVDVGGGLGITYTDEQPPRGRRAGGARCCSAWTRAATATASCCSSPAARWSATPACC